MTLKAPDAQSLFADLMRSQNGETIIDLFNPIHDAVFKFKNIGDEDVKELGDLLAQISGDTLFNEFIIKFFTFLCYVINFIYPFI